MFNGLEQTLIIESKALLTLEDGLLSICYKDSKESYSFNNIECIIISYKPATLISSSLLVELIRNNILVIFLDEKHNPILNALPLYGSFNSVDVLIKQIKWNSNRKIMLSNNIIKNKIEIEGNTLIHERLEDKHIFIDYKNEVEFRDIKNREGLVAKMYFTRLFGKDFNRRKKEDNINIFLNYGYSLIVSFMNQEIVSHGYKTEIGIYHHNKTNLFNLTYDLFEPFRSLVDEYVFENCKDIELTFESKNKLLDVFDRYILINKKKYQLKEGIRKFIIGCISYLENKTNEYPKVEYIYE